MEYLKADSQGDSKQYLRAQEIMDQGRYYYDNADNVYRENKMAENFIWEFDRLTGENVMGVYGGAHVDLEAMDYSTQTVGSMANQLKEYYGIRYIRRILQALLITCAENSGVWRMLTMISKTDPGREMSCLTTIIRCRSGQNRSLWSITREQTDQS